MAYQVVLVFCRNCLGNHHKGMVEYRLYNPNKPSCDTIVICWLSRKQKKKGIFDEASIGH